ncbi:zinc-finger domain-containing protein [Methanomethylovorans sp.]|uniref:zinc-finger domain-containing protein n=1 Tax=Methanomethylovorans sp. TaxID=2758717 RepID=UPI00351C5176
MGHRISICFIIAGIDQVIRSSTICNGNDNLVDIYCRTANVKTNFQLEQGNVISHRCC